MKKIFILLVAVLIMVITGCSSSSSSPAPLSSAKAITAFSLNGFNGFINETGKTITVGVPIGTDLTSITPAITHTGASISPAGAQNFSLPVDYTVTAADASTAIYTVTVSFSGTLDATYFNPTGDLPGAVTTAIGTKDIANGVAVQSDGKIVVAGESDNAFALARYNTDGSLDTTFGTLGVVITPIGTDKSIANSVAIQSDGKIVAAGYSKNAGAGNHEDFAVARYTTSGALDTTSFNSTGTIPGVVVTNIGATDLKDIAHGVAIQTDQKIVVAGESDNAFALARYNTDGSLDTDFDGDGVVTTAIGTEKSIANSIAIQSDQKIVAAGYSKNTGAGNHEDFAIARYTTSGALDTTSFNSTGTIPGVVVTNIGATDLKDIANGVAIQPDGKIVAVGESGEDFALVRYWP
ncbi:MAG: hypothetical protein NTW65_04305 [Deltaproteobacteria bacterium]|nr:hypothetical protein [Deltaproteobacteria bacterium]